MELFLIHVDMASHHCPRDDWYGLFIDDRLYLAPPVIMQVRLEISHTLQFPSLHSRKSGAAIHHGVP
jgi:hypothetical protein